SRGRSTTSSTTPSGGPSICSASIRVWCAGARPSAASPPNPRSDPSANMEGGYDTDLDAEGPHWSFAVDLYARPAVSEACLVLQPRLGGDVCLLLFALFIAREHQIGLAAGDFARLDDAVADWRREVIGPLRSLRRRLKLGPHPAPSQRTNAMRQL